MTTCVVVGGGVVGLLCALLAKEKHGRVVLVEKSGNCGGLLGSFERNGACYDFGTHIPAPTGIPELDAILYGPAEERERNFHSFPYLLSENYHNGHWYQNSPLIDTRTLPQAQYDRGVVELLQAEGASREEKNLYRYLRSTFGETFTEAIYRPVMRKIQGAELEALDVDVLRLFGLQRLIALTPEVARSLKALPRYDASLGYHSYTEGAVAIPYVYPKGGAGIGAWPIRLEKRAREMKCEILLRDSVSRIDHSGGRIGAVELASGARLPCDQLVWTIPPIFACRAAGIEIAGDRPSFRTHTLVHLRYAKALRKTRPQYLLCWEPAMASYRITLYPNITPERAAANVHNLTVEILGDAGAAQHGDQIAATVVRELAESGVVDVDNTVIDQAVEFLGPSFPVMTPGFREAAERQSAALKESCSNIELLGRGGAAFFINDLLVQAWRTLKGRP